MISKKAQPFYYSLNFQLLYASFLRFHLLLLLICSFWVLSSSLFMCLFSFLTPNMKHTFFKLCNWSFRSCYLLGFGPLTFLLSLYHGNLFPPGCFNFRHRKKSCENTSINGHMPLCFNKCPIMSCSLCKIIFFLWKGKETKAPRG